MLQLLSFPDMKNSGTQIEEKMKNQKILESLNDLAKALLSKFEGDPKEVLRSTGENKKEFSKVMAIQSVNKALKNLPALLEPSTSSDTYRKVVSASGIRRALADFMRQYSHFHKHNDTKEQSEKIFAELRRKLQEAEIFLKAGQPFVNR